MQLEDLTDIRTLLTAAAVVISIVAAIFAWKMRSSPLSVQLRAKQIEVICSVADIIDRWNMQVLVTLETSKFANTAQVNAAIDKYYDLMLEFDERANAAKLLLPKKILLTISLNVKNNIESIAILKAGKINNIELFCSEFRKIMQANNLKFEKACREFLHVPGQIDDLKWLGGMERRVARDFKKTELAIRSGERPSK